MRNLVVLVILIAFVSQTQAQRKHSFSVGVDVVKNSKPGAWKDKAHVEAHDHNPRNPDFLMGLRYVPWVNYSYDNLVGFKCVLSRFSQSANYIPFEQTPKGFVDARQGKFIDFMLGYNLLKKWSPKYFSAWVYAGTGYNLRNTEISTYTYIPSWGHGMGGGRDYNGKWSPVIQVTAQYYPVRFAFVGLGATYRYIGSDFQVWTGRLSVGLRF